MDINEIAAGLEANRYGVLLHDGSELTERYVIDNFIGFANSLDDSQRLCVEDSQTRKNRGRHLRYAISERRVPRPPLIIYYVCLDESIKSAELEEALVGSR